MMSDRTNLSFFVLDVGTMQFIERHRLSLHRYCQLWHPVDQLVQLLQCRNGHVHLLWSLNGTFSFFSQEASVCTKVADPLWTFLKKETFLFWWRLGKAIFFKCSFMEIWEVLTVVPDEEEQEEEGGEAMKPQQNAGHSAEEESSSSAD